MFEKKTDLGFFHGHRYVSSEKKKVPVIPAIPAFSQTSEKKQMTTFGIDPFSVWGKNVPVIPAIPAFSQTSEKKQMTTFGIDPFSVWEKKFLFFLFFSQTSESLLNRGDI